MLLRSQGPKREETLIWLRAYLRNCATLATKAPAPGCSTFPACKYKIGISQLHCPRYLLQTPKGQSPATSWDGHQGCVNFMSTTTPRVNPFRPPQHPQAPRGPVLESEGDHSPTQMSPNTSGRSPTSCRTAVITAESSSSGVVSCKHTNTRYRALKATRMSYMARACREGRISSVPSSQDDPKGQQPDPTTHIPLSYCEDFCPSSASHTPGAGFAQLSDFGHYH